MTNEEIRNEMNELTEKFNGNCFVFNEENRALVARIGELQKMCGHSDGLHSFARAGYKCPICDKMFVGSGN